jgi:four helix bundle protein
MKNTDKSLAFEERLLKFSEVVLLFCKNIKETTTTKPLISQIIRSATSIGTNYCEANNASSRKDFKNKIFICKKES